MSKNSNLGGSSNMRTQIQNLWQAINTIETGGGGGTGTGNVNYTPTSGTIGSHYKISSSNGENCVESSINETNTDFTFGNKNLGAIGIISGDSFVKSGGSNQQYLMADGSALTYSSNSGNSNYYLFLNSTGGSTSPADGYITYNQNTFQFQSTMIYISHLTSDGVDIEVFFKQLSTLSEVYIQDKSNGRFMQFNITGAPIITAGQNVAIPVLIRTSSTTGLAPNRQLMISFFTNSIEVDQRLSTVEGKTQNQSGVLNQTNFAGTIQADTIQISASSPNLHLMSDGSTRDITTVSNGGPVGGQSLVKIGYGTNPSIQLNSISAFNGVGLTLNNGNISLSNTATLSNAGILTGLSLVSNGSAPSYSIKSLDGMNGCTVSEASDVITISNTSPASDISLANAGSGTSLISSTSTNPAFKTKSITQGTGISIVDLSNNLTISATGSYLPLAGGNMAGTINMNNNLITGLQRLTFNTSSTAIGSSAGLTSQGTNSVAVGSGCGQTSQGNESLAIGYNSGQSNQLGSAVAVGRGCGQTSQGALCVALGNVAGTTSQSTASIAIGNQAGATTQGGASESCVAIGNFTGNDNQGGFSVAIGKEAGRVTQGANCVAIGNQAGRNSQSPNSIVLNASGAVLDSTTTGLFIKPVRNEFNTNTILYNSTSGELTYSEMGSYLPELSPEYKPNIWYYITTTSTFIGGVFTASTQITAIGGTLTQIATSNTNWRTRKSGRINCPTVSVADGQRSGFIGTATFPAIYSGSGWFFSFDFSITDTNISATAVTRMFVGFGITTIAPGLSSTVAISSLQNMIGIGHDSGDTVLSFYSRGPAVGTANGNKIATTFSCATPSTKIFTATFYSPTNSDDIMIKLYDQETRTSAYQTFTLGGTLTPISTSPLIPVWVRAMATGGGTTNSAQLGLNGFKWYTL